MGRINVTFRIFEGSLNPNKSVAKHSVSSLSIFSKGVSIQTIQLVSYYVQNLQILNLIAGMDKHTFSAFWLWSSVVSVLISVTTDMSSNWKLSCHDNFSRGVVSDCLHSAPLTGRLGIVHLTSAANPLGNDSAINISILRFTWTITVAVNPRRAQRDPLFHFLNMRCFLASGGCRPQRATKNCLDSRWVWRELELE